MHTIKWIIALCFVFSATFSEARPLRYPSNISQKQMPCNGDFDLTIAITPASDNALVTTVSADTMPIGLHIQMDRQRRGLASHINDGPIQNVGYDKCSKWQQKYWPLLSRVLFQNKSPGRAHLACHNIANIHYKLGQENRQAKVCLADAGEDSLTAGFRKFYDGTELLTWSK